MTLWWRRWKIWWPQKRMTSCGLLWCILVRNQSCTECTPVLDQRIMMQHIIPYFTIPGTGNELESMLKLWRRRHAVKVNWLKFTQIWQKTSFCCCRKKCTQQHIHNLAVFYTANTLLSLIVLYPGQGCSGSPCMHSHILGQLCVACPRTWIVRGNQRTQRKPMQKRAKLYTDSISGLSQRRWRCEVATAPTVASCCPWRKQKIYNCTKSEMKHKTLSNNLQ